MNLMYPTIPISQVPSLQLPLCWIRVLCVENATWMLTMFNCFGRQFCLHFEAFVLGMSLLYMDFLRFMGDDDDDAKKFHYSLDVGGSERKLKLEWQGIPRSIRDSHSKVRDSLIHRDLALFLFSGGDGQKPEAQAQGCWPAMERSITFLLFPPLPLPLLACKMMHYNVIAIILYVTKHQELAH